MMKCTGLVFRYRKNVYSPIRGGFAVKHELIPLKRDSCKCDVCEAVFQEFNDIIAECEIFPSFDRIEKDFVNGEKYRMIICTWDEDELSVRFEQIKGGE